MMKKFYNVIFIIFFSVFFIHQNNYAQNITAVPNINPYPSPYTTDWETNPAALGSVTLFNNSNSDLQVKLRVRINLNNKGIVFISTGNVLDVPAFSSLIVNNTQITKIENTEFPNSELKNQIQQTGRLPEGNYTACFDVINLNDIPILSNTCANFKIIYPEPPHIIYPANNDSLQANTMYPVFQWTPVIVPPDYQIRYIIKICEILQGQTPLQALSSNIPILEDQNILNSTLVYPISAPPLEKDKKYVWQVQVLDQYNYPPTKNDGKSEIFTFQFKQPKQPGNELTLVEPANNSVLKNKTPKFSWTGKI